MSSVCKALVLAAVAAGLLCACSTRESRLPETERQGPAEFPEAYYLQAMARGKAVYRVDPVHSRVVIEVRRGGSLARLGHDHVVASHDVVGYVSPEDGRADLYIRLDDLVVDEPALRADAGFDTQPTESEIEGTRRNMLQKALEADRYPFALIHVAGPGPVDDATGLDVAITLHGTTRAIKVPVRREIGSEAIDVTGRLALDQTDFGITPFAILGGAIAVRDRLDLSFRIHARRVAVSGVP